MGGLLLFVCVRVCVCVCVCVCMGGGLASLEGELKRKVEKEWGYFNSTVE